MHKLEIDYCWDRQQTSWVKKHVSSNRAVKLHHVIIFITKQHNSQIPGTCSCVIPSSSLDSSSAVLNHSIIGAAFSRISRAFSLPTCFLDTCRAITQNNS